MIRAVVLIVLGASMWLVPGVLVERHDDPVGFCAGISDDNAFFGVTARGGGEERISGAMRLSVNLLTQRVTCSWSADSIKGDPPVDEAGSIVISPALIPHGAGLVIFGAGAWLLVRSRLRRRQASGI